MTNDEMKRAVDLLAEYARTGLLRSGAFAAICPRNWRMEEMRMNGLKQYKLFTADNREPAERNNARMAEFTAFLNYLSTQRKKHTTTIWTSTDGHETGFCVWYN